MVGNSCCCLWVWHVVVMNVVSSCRCLLNTWSLLMALFGEVGEVWKAWPYRRKYVPGDGLWELKDPKLYPPVGSVPPPLSTLLLGDRVQQGHTFEISNRGTNRGTNAYGEHSRTASSRTMCDSHLVMLCDSCAVVILRVAGLYYLVLAFLWFWD